MWLANAEVLVPSVVTIIYEAFDGICEKHGMNRVKTVGNSYMVVPGLSDRKTMDLAVAIFHFVMACQNEVNELCSNQVHELEGNARVRYSIHSGFVSESLTQILNVASFL
jgi:adenylate cyclase